MSLDQTHNRKMLNSMLKHTDEEERILELNIEQLNKQLEDKKKKKEEIKSKLQAKDIIISEHAILRYAQHFLGIDLESIEKIIRDEQILRCHKTLGNGTYPSSDNTFKAVIKNNVVVTVYPC